MVASSVATNALHVSHQKKKSLKKRPPCTLMRLRHYNSGALLDALATLSVDRRRPRHHKPVLIDFPRYL
jgi:hypothetical protein